MNADNSIRLSIVIASYNASKTIGRALATLAAQTTREGWEAIVVDSSTDGTADLVAHDFPWVRLIRCDTRKYCGDARNLGIAQAHGDLIAFTDADCLADPDFAGAILRAHDRYPDPVIGGAIANGNPENYTGWAYYYTEFSQWMPGSPPGHVADIPGCCLSLKRSAFERYGPFIEGTYCSDSAFHWALARDGHHPRFEPSIRVAHLNPTRFGNLLRHEVGHGRNFATVRIDRKGASGLKRLAYVLASPILPALLFGRAARRALGDPRHRFRFLKAAPAVFLAQSAWSLGEFRGYLARLFPTRQAESESGRRSSAKPVEVGQP